MSLSLMRNNSTHPQVENGSVTHGWSPYTDNGGSIVAIGGQGFAVIASDTRLSTGFQIYTREQPKLKVLNKHSVLGFSGCWCDCLTLSRVVESRLTLYKHEHHREMSTAAVAQMISTLLYNKRFFPYYVSNVVAGLDEEGNGVVYSYDPVGHCDKDVYHAGGSSGALLQPLLDSQVGLMNMEIKPKEPMSIVRALQIVKDVFTSAAERDIYTGDGILIKIITKEGVKEDTFALRAD